MILYVPEVILATLYKTGQGVWSDLGYLICLKRLFRSREKLQIWFFLSKKTRIIFRRAQPVMNMKYKCHDLHTVQIVRLGKFIL